MDDESSLRLEYDTASQLLRGLTETRFKLLALVPTLAGAVVGFASAGKSAVALLSIGLLGLAATSGVLIYELRNGEIAGKVARRVQVLEDLLLPGKRLVPGADARVLGVVPASHALGVGLVYGAAISGWLYLFSWGALRALGLQHHAQGAGLAIGVVAGVAAAAEILRIELGLEHASEGEAPARQQIATS
jgi:hypothetical protein